MRFDMPVKVGGDSRAVLNKCDTGAMSLLDGSVRDGNGAILYPRAAEAAFDLEGRDPSPSLATFVQGYWIIRWDRRSLPPFVQRVLPSPSVNVTLKRGRSRVAGLTLGMFTEVLEGCHVVFGVRFRPGGFRPFLGAPVSSISGRFLPIGEVFGPAGVALERPVLEAGSTDEMVTLVEAFLSERLPPPDPMVALVAAMVADIAADSRLTRVDEVARRWQVGVRRLQRVFAEYVGASPKWVIRRYRMQEAAASAAVGPVDWAGLALDLGYSDQAHFSRDFSATVGVTPSGYTRLCAGGEVP
jgi:AraC-like DNA-binding protein